MVQNMLAKIIAQEFDSLVGKFQHQTGKAMHIGFRMDPGRDRLHVIHMYLYAPLNYVYVLTQSERVEQATGKRTMGDMEVLCYHDLIFPGAVKEFICDNNEAFESFESFDPGKWRDVIVLTEEERDYITRMDQDRKGIRIAPLPANPFNKRGEQVAI